MNFENILLALLAAQQTELVNAVSAITGPYNNILNYHDPAIYHPFETFHANYNPQPILDYRDALPDWRSLGHTKHVVVKDVPVYNHHSDIHLFPPAHHMPPHYQHEKPHWIKIKRIEFINQHDGHGFRKLIEYDFSRAAAEMMQQQHLIAKRYAKQNTENINFPTQTVNDRDKRALYSSYLPLRPLYTSMYLPKTKYYMNPAYINPIVPPSFIPPLPYNAMLYPQLQKSNNLMLASNLYNPYLLKRYRRETLHYVDPELENVRKDKRFTLLHFPAHHKILSHHTFHRPTLIYHHFRARGDKHEQHRNNPVSPHDTDQVPHSERGSVHPPTYFVNQQHIPYPLPPQHLTAEKPHQLAAPLQHSNYPPPHSHIWPQLYYPQQSN